MAVDSLKLEQVRLLAAKAETDTGVAEAVTASEAAFIAFDPIITPDDPMNDRQLPAGLGALPSVPGLPTGQASFSIEMAGNGGAGVPAWASTFLPACDFANSSGTFSFSRSNTTLSIYAYEDGMIRGLVGARGTFQITGEPGGIARAAFTFMGRYIESTDGSILAPTFPTVAPPIVGSAGTNGFSFDGTNFPIGSFTIDAANDVQMRLDANATGGVRQAAIVNRRPTYTIDPEDLGRSSYDWRTKRDSGASNLAFSLRLGSTENNIIRVTSSTAQLLQVPRDFRNGIATRNVSGLFTTADAFKIIFS
jgi:hypothetical protein